MGSIEFDQSRHSLRNVCRVERHRSAAVRLRKAVQTCLYSAANSGSSVNVRMIQIDRLMKELARDRPVFHSEADFQHSLGWQIHRTNPEHAVRFEYKPRAELAMYVDLWLATAGVVVELKYRTRKLECEIGGEPFLLCDQAAGPPSRYSFLKDVERLEFFVSTVPDVRSGLGAVFDQRCGVLEGTVTS